MEPCRQLSPGSTWGTGEAGARGMLWLHTGTGGAGLGQGSGGAAGLAVTMAVPAAPCPCQGCSAQLLREQGSASPDCRDNLAWGNTGHQISVWAFRGQGKQKEDNELQVWPRLPLVLPSCSPQCWDPAVLGLAEPGGASPRQHQLQGHACPCLG